ncbi:hypothetical protein ABT337_23770 [Saccharopolyspora hirsuta]|uniref:Uncharacterized protein n=1 Tax=Saccharopolyspora hirsuta TaxID=1837 RepID=A0A5M7C3D8_SACHI|nr:hypothetical protein [Saccharopolyspora hirsuta]KAA5835960.1 hypothetical protein F1721_06285 [Saccharopolyspora hirsuta]
MPRTISTTATTHTAQTASTAGVGGEHPGPAEREDQRAEHGDAERVLELLGGRHRARRRPGLVRAHLGQRRTDQRRQQESVAQPDERQRCTGPCPVAKIVLDADRAWWDSLRGATLADISGRLSETARARARAADPSAP